MSLTSYLLALGRACTNPVRLATGKGEFTMEYLRHSPVLPTVQKDMMEAHRSFTTKK